MSEHPDLEHQFEDYERPMEPPEPEEPETWMRYEIRWNHQHDEALVHIFCSTNDNKDTGYPGEYAEWTIQCDNPDEAIEHTGIDRPGTHVTLNGRPLLTTNAHKHMAMGEVIRIKNSYDQEIQHYIDGYDAVRFYQAHQRMLEEIERFVAENTILLKGE